MAAKEREEEAEEASIPAVGVLPGLGDSQPRAQLRLLGDPDEEPLPSALDRGFEDQVVLLAASHLSELCEHLFRLRFIAGEEPFGRGRGFSHSFPVGVLVPPGSFIERDHQTSNTHDLLLRGRGWTALLSQDPRETSARVTARSARLVERVMEAIVARAPDAPSETDRSSVVLRLWRHNGGQPVGIARRIDVPVWDDIQDHYPTAVRTELARLTALREPADSGGKLVLLHGPPGVGKTTFLRALAYAWRSWCEIHYVIDPDAFFGDAGYMLAPIEARSLEPGPPKTRLLIIEDIDALIYAQQSGRNEPFARLLNLADGIPGQGRRLLLALTTNAKPSSLHPAVSRPGRALARIELRPFSAAEASEWLGSPQGHELTLAELLERQGDIQQVRNVDGSSDASTGQYL